MQRVLPFVLLCFLTGCFNDPRDNWGTGIIGLLMMIVGWKMGTGPANNWSKVWGRVGFGLLVLGALCLIA